MSEPINRPVVLTVAGSDSAGMAGIAVDIRTQTALGVHCALALSANTAQNSSNLLAVNAVHEDQLRHQLDASCALQPCIVKAGMLATAAQVRVLRDHLQRRQLSLIYDPVLQTTAGQTLGANDLAKSLNSLFEHCLLLTPNLEEAAVLTGISGRTHEDIEQMAQQLVARGAHAVLIKGGHLAGDYCRDYFLSQEHSFWLSSPARVGNVRGTGCALASAIAASVACGYTLADAVVIGKMAINQGIRQAYACADGSRTIHKMSDVDRDFESCADASRTVHITGFPNAAADLPFLHTEGRYLPEQAFPTCDPQALGLYPVVDRAHWLERLLPLGISTAQLRIKDLQGQELAEEIERAIAIARHYDCRLFINDHWMLALTHDAYGVHLGQEDLGTADLASIKAAGLRLGISSHCHYEVARAHALRPSYIACGPVYPTTSKQMPWRPQGLDGLQYWQSVLSAYPVVAIGGVDLSRIRAVAQTGAAGIAMISAITEASDPEGMTRQLLAALKESAD